MQLKHGIIALASVAFIFSAADLNAATNNIEELKYVELSSATAMQQPLSSGHYIIADASKYTAGESTVMSDADATFTITDEDAGAVEMKNTIFVDMERSANEIIGEPIYDEAGVRIGTVHDVIVDRSGQMMTVIVADGGPLSIGDKKAAFNSDELYLDDASGQYRMNIGEEDIASANTFSYDPTKASTKVDVMPPEGISVKKLAQAKLVDHNNEVVADIDNISFDANKSIDQLIVSYDKILGMGGDVAALDFSKLRLVEDRKGLRMQMTGNQSAEFRAVGE